MGTRWCECALFVGWVCTRDLDVDSQKALCWLVLEAEEFERLVASFTERRGESAKIHTGGKADPRVQEYLSWR